MEGWDNLVGTWVFTNIFPFALVVASNCVDIKMPKLTPLYLKGWALKPTWKF
jgi:hypothetical protein